MVVWLVADNKKDGSIPLFKSFLVHSFCPSVEAPTSHSRKMTNGHLQLTQMSMALIILAA